jgi:hypothetical protein
MTANTLGLTSAPDAGIHMKLPKVFGPLHTAPLFT